MKGQTAVFQRASQRLDEMQDFSWPQTTLYERILGTEWNRLAEIVRKAHLETYGEPARGRFRIMRGKGRLAKALAGVLRLPAAGENIPVQLEITSHGRGEQWLRKFGTKRLTTLQYEAPGGLLAEKFGVLEFRFRLTVVDDCLRYSQESVFLCIGRQRIPLPRWISPSVSATESAAVSAGRTHVKVTVSMPWVGLLIAYDGDLEIPSRSA